MSKNLSDIYISFFSRSHFIHKYLDGQSTNFCVISLRWGFLTCTSLEPPGGPISRYIHVECIRPLPHSIIIGRQADGQTDQVIDRHREGEITGRHLIKLPNTELPSKQLCNDWYNFHFSSYYSVMWHLFITMWEDREYLSGYHPLIIVCDKYEIIYHLPSS